MKNAAEFFSDNFPGPSEKTCCFDVTLLLDSILIVCPNHITRFSQKPSYRIGVKIRQQLLMPRPLYRPDATWRVLMPLVAREALKPELLPLVTATKIASRATQGLDLAQLEDVW